MLFRSDRIMPEIVIPMHYRTKDCKLDIDKVDEFLKLFDEDIVEEYEENSLELLRSDLNDGTRILVLRKN